MTHLQQYKLNTINSIFLYNAFQQVVTKMNGVLIGFSTFFNNLQSFGNCWSSTTVDSYFRPVRLVHHSTFSCAVVHFGSCILEWANVDWTTMSSLRQCFAATAFRGTAAVAVGSRLGWDIGVVPRMKVERIGQVSIKWCILTGSHGLVVWYFALMYLMCMLIFSVDWGVNLCCQLHTLASCRCVFVARGCTTIATCE